MTEIKVNLQQKQTHHYHQELNQSTNDLKSDLQKADVTGFHHLLHVFECV